MASRTTPATGDGQWQQQLPGQPLLLTPEEAAHLLSIGRTQVFALLSAGDLESVRVGRLRRIPFDACVAFVERLRGASSPTG
jgi:excisionase family DNA binding protein